MFDLLNGFWRGFRDVLLLALCAYALIPLLGALGGH
jgi:hypothetical protein